jgi:hypothetical protein
MRSSGLRQHATRIVDYAIRAAFVSVVGVPLLFFLSMSGGLGSEPPEHGEQFFGFVLFVAIAPAYYTLMLVHGVGISFDFLDWMVGVLVVPLFWGAIAYGVVQFCRVLLRVPRQRRTGDGASAESALSD